MVCFETEGVINEMPEDRQELTFEQRLALAKVLYEAVISRNRYIESFGGFDTFAEVWQYVDENRNDYEKLEATVSSARANFFNKVSDKELFIKALKIADEVEMAGLISRMFFLSVEKEKKPKRSLLSYFFKRK